MCPFYKASFLSNLNLQNCPPLRRRKTRPMNNLRRRPGDKDYGGSALEYLIVSLFSLLLAIAAIHFVGKVIKKHAAEIETKAGISLELPEIFGEE